jgi:predicted MFS family arabinose efflux permease
MITMRLLIGSVFRKVSGMKIMFASIALMAAGLAILRFTGSFNVAIAGLILVGAGLAAGFPIMLGFIGSRFTDLSATAFSFAFVIALLGNILINYLTGLIVQAYGVQQMIYVAAAEVLCMFVLCIFIRKHS